MNAMTQAVRSVLFFGCLSTAPLFGLTDQSPRNATNSGGADASVVTARAASEAAKEDLYVQVDTFDPIDFERMRYAWHTGEDLIVTTLRDTAAEQAAYANANYNVIVLDDKAAAPAGAKVLRLTWGNGAVLAELFDGVQTKPKFLGVVSRTSISLHPKSTELYNEVFRAGLSDSRRDASIRVGLKMNLYLALQRTARELRKG